MIFVTVGAQMPFDRLVRAVDAWAERASNSAVFAQIGRTRYRPRHVRYTAFLAPPEFRATFSQAQLIVSHAGMGTIINALEQRKPILVMPRRGDLGETRNDHQVATARRLGGYGLIEVAMDEAELVARLHHHAVALASSTDGVCICQRTSVPCTYASPACTPPLRGGACPRLLAALHTFVDAPSAVHWPALRCADQQRGRDDEHPLP